MQQDNHMTTRSQRALIFAQNDRKSDRIISVSLILYFLFGIFLSGFYDTYTVAIGVGGLSLVLYFGVKTLLPHSTLYQYVLSSILAVFSAQFIYQMHGLFEMHFFVFVGSTLLITYQNWRLQLPLIVLVVLHHASFAYLQYLGNDQIFFTQLSYMDLQAFLFHGALAAIIVGICGYWAYDLEQKTLSQARGKIALESKLRSINASIAFAGEISSGNLQAGFTLHDEQDELGRALLKMRDNLVIANEKDRQEKFISVGLSKIGQIISTSNQSLQALADDFVSTVVKYTGVNQGALFLIDGEGDSQHLKLTACYAYDRKKYINRELAIGEGLVGQCFLERDVIYLTQVPQNYTKITSGLGEATPRCVLLIPVMTREEIIGVIELASFDTFETYHLEFLKKASENIAASIVSSRITQRVKKLLEESQMQAETMRAQEEEMRQNIEELTATQEEMRRREQQRSRTENLSVYAMR